MRKPHFDKDAPTFSDADLKMEMKKYRATMFDIVDKARQDDVEYGFNICWDNEKKATYPSDVCKGEKSCVYMKQCGWPDQFASVHVHPRGSGWLPSPGDVVGALQESDALICIGVIGHKSKKDIYQCYAPTEDGETTKRFIDAYYKGDYDTMTVMSIKALMHPSESTVYRPVFKMSRKRVW